MNRWLRHVIAVFAVSTLAIFCAAADRLPQTPSASTSSSTPNTASIYLVTNEDMNLPFDNSLNFYLSTGTMSNPNLEFANSVVTGGYGADGGFFGTSRLLVLPVASPSCMYASDATSGDIATIALPSQEAVAMFTGSSTDTGAANGIGLAMNANYLYASFTDSNKIGTFAVQPGCGLSFLGDVSAVGLNGGSVTGMRTSGNILVVAYGDGSIQSFNIAHGMPVSNNDAQITTGYATNNQANGVDITQDGRFAIFGDSAQTSVVEVSNISSGKLTRTTVYNVGAGVSASSVWLSPDETLLYISNSQGGTVTAAFFNKTTGVVSPGCTSPTLGGFFNPWQYVGSLSTQNTTGTGGVLYVAEYGFFLADAGAASNVGMVVVQSNGTTCSLTEAANSPISDSSNGLLSITTIPPRLF